MEPKTYNSVKESPKHFLTVCCILVFVCSLAGFVILVFLWLDITPAVFLLENDLCDEIIRFD